MTACGDSSSTSDNEKSSISNGTISESGSCGENVKWELYSNGKLVISGTGKMEKYGHPEFLEDDEKISPFYQKAAWIKSVEISENVNSISEYAFCKCENITSVAIGKDVTEIADNAFYSCSSISEITIPGNVKRIGDFSFCYCSKLSNLTIEDGVEEIGTAAFRDNTNLKSVSIPESVTVFGNFAFAYHSTDTKTPGFTIKGKAGSAAEKYCQEEHLAFESE